MDLLSFPESKDVVVREDEEALKEILYSLGFDVYKYGYEYQIVLHRPLTTNKPIKTGRFIGYERDDEEWLNSGMCSEEKRLGMMYLKDKEFVKDLERMSEYPKWTLIAMEHYEEIYGGL